MRESLEEDVSVITVYDAKTKIMKPYKINWHGYEYLLGPIDFYHTTKRGTTTVHHFSMADADQTTYFKISLESTNLRWKLEEHMTADEANVTYAHEQT